MNRQRKIVITVTYNDLGVIVDTKAEELNSSAQPNLQPTCNQLATDVISRQQAIEKFTMTAPQMSTIHIYEAVEILDAMPTVQPEPKEGHWKKDESDDCPIVFQQFRICSVCGTIEMSETNYCPNCGAKMKGVRNETN